MSPQKVIGALVLIVLLFFVISQPLTSAHIVTDVLGALGRAAGSLLLFLRSLF